MELQCQLPPLPPPSLPLIRSASLTFWGHLLSFASWPPFRALSFWRNSKQNDDLYFFMENNDILPRGGC